MTEQLSEEVTWGEEYERRVQLQLTGKQITVFHNLWTMDKSCL